MDKDLKQAEENGHRMVAHTNYWASCLVCHSQLAYSGEIWKYTGRPRSLGKPEGAAIHVRCATTIEGSDLKKSSPKVKKTLDKTGEKV